MKSILLVSILAVTTCTLSCTKKENSIVTNANGDDNPNSSNGDGDNNPGKSKSQMAYRLTATNTSSGLARTTAGIIQWTSALANPQQVKFEAKQGTSETEYKSFNSTPIDLLAPTATSFGNFSITAGTYTELELKIQLLGNSTVPSLQLKGTFDNGSVSLPVEVSIDELIELKTEQHNVEVVSNFDFTVITSINLSFISNGITEDAITTATLTNGTVIISKSSNKTLYDILLTNIANMRHHVEVETNHK